jgi:hypothetical protein
MTKWHKELTDIPAQTDFKGADVSPINLWTGVKKEFPHICSVAVKKLRPIYKSIWNGIKIFRNKDELPK